MLRLTSLALSAALGSLMLASPASALSSDPWITGKTKLALVTAEGVNPMRINVDTVNGRVTLHGIVRSDAERLRAEEVARGIDGVTAVQNLLQIVPERAADAVEAADDRIEEQVSERLAEDATLADGTISVQSVNEGVVLLAGMAKTLSDHLRAVQLAGTVPGVRRVASEIVSPSEIGDDEIYRDLDHGPKAAPESDRDISAKATDTWITTAIKMRLLADSDVPGLDVNVDSRNGVVTLFGTVPSAQSKAKAEAEARKTSGVRDVRNELQVVPTKVAEAVAERDDAIDARLDEALDGDARLGGASIDVEVHNGVARLSGTVDSQATRLTAAVVARGVRGVRAVQNDLRVSRS